MSQSLATPLAQGPVRPFSQATPPILKPLVGVIDTPLLLFGSPQKPVYFPYSISVELLVESEGQGLVVKTCVSSFRQCQVKL